MLNSKSEFNPDQIDALMDQLINGQVIAESSDIKAVSMREGLRLMFGGEVADSQAKSGILSAVVSQVNESKDRTLQRFQQSSKADVYDTDKRTQPSILYDPVGDLPTFRNDQNAALVLAISSGRLAIVSDPPSGGSEDVFAWKRNPNQDQPEADRGNSGPTLAPEMIEWDGNLEHIPAARVFVVTNLGHPTQDISNRLVFSHEAIIKHNLNGEREAGALIKQLYLKLAHPDNYLSTLYDAIVDQLKKDALLQLQAINPDGHTRTFSRRGIGSNQSLADNIRHEQRTLERINTLDQLGFFEPYMPPQELIRIVDNSVMVKVLVAEVPLKGETPSLRSALQVANCTISLSGSEGLFGELVVNINRVPKR